MSHKSKPENIYLFVFIKFSTCYIKISQQNINYQQTLWHDHRKLSKFFLTAHMKLSYSLTIHVYHIIIVEIKININTCTLKAHPHTEMLCQKVWLIFKSYPKSTMSQDATKHFFWQT